MTRMIAQHSLGDYRTWRSKGVGWSGAWRGRPWCRGAPGRRSRGGAPSHSPKSTPVKFTPMSLV
eukprot:1300327-Rhodomonas_salina.1